MTLARLCAAVGVVALAALAAACAKPAPAPEPEAAVTTEVQAWRAKHEADYRRDWVTIAGLHFLHEGAQTAGSAKANDVVLPASAPATLGRFVVDGATGPLRARARAPVDLKGTRVTAPVVLKDDGGSGADELVDRHREDRRARQRQPPLAARVGSRRPAGARLQGVHLVPDSARLARDRALHSRRVAAHAPGDQHVRRPRHLHHAGRRRVHAQRADAAPAAVHHAAEAVLLRLQGRVERRRRPTPRRASCTPICATTAPPCSTSTRPTIRHARSTRTRPARFRCPRTGCR